MYLPLRNTVRVKTVTKSMSAQNFNHIKRPVLCSQLLTCGCTSQTKFTGFVQTKHQWNSVSTTEIWLLRKTHMHSTPPLRVSFPTVASETKRCFGCKEVKSKTETKTDLERDVAVGPSFHLRLDVLELFLSVFALRPLLRQHLGDNLTPRLQCRDLLSVVLHILLLVVHREHASMIKNTSKGRKNASRQYKRHTCTSLHFVWHWLTKWLMLNIWHPVNYKGQVKMKHQSSNHVTAWLVKMLIKTSGWLLLKISDGLLYRLLICMWWFQAG